MVKKDQINKIINIARKINQIYQRIAITEITDQSIDKLKKLILKERTIYEEVCPTTSECVELINIIETEGLSNDELDDFRENAINRVLNKLKYMYLEATYISNGAYKHIIDKYTQMLYSEFMNSMEEYPKLKEQLMFSAFFILSLSPSIELDVLEREFIPYTTYNDDLFFYARLKRSIARQIASTEKDSKWFTKEDARYSGIDHVYRESVEEFINPYLRYTLKVLLDEFRKEDNNYYIYSLIELKVQLAMLPKPIRERKYQEIIEMYKKENIEAEKITMLNQTFIEIETDIVTKVDYIPRGFQNIKASN